MTEREWQRQVLDLAAWHRWALTYHAPDNRPDARGRVQSVTRGFPDLILLKGRRLLAVELKTETGRVTPEQRKWLTGLAAAGVEVDVWRPSDTALAVAVLAGRREARGLPVPVPA